MTTFAVYCHGTGFNRVKATESNELVAWFHNHTDGSEARLAGSLVTPGSYLINEGPGSGMVGGIALPQQVNPITGNRISGSGGGGSSFSKALGGKTSTSKLTRSNKVGNALGNLSGLGWDENVIRTVNIIQDMIFEHGQAIDRVNLAGWSRGAVTCIRIAAALNEVFGNELECNIFGVDPVAGLSAGKTIEDTTRLTPNVARYIAIIAMHEMRKSFKPQDWSRLTVVDPGRTTAVMLPMPGVHNAQVIPNEPAYAAYITRNLACGFLRSLGTSIDGVPYNFLCSAADMCEGYARLVMGLSEHKSYQTSGMKNRLVGGGLRRRSAAKHSRMDLYTRGGKESYWINEHHRACFAAAYPGAYQTIFEDVGNGNLLLSKVDSRLFQAVGSSAFLRDSLMSKGLLTDDPTYTVEVGGGRYADRRVSVWPATFPLHA
ncbi:hypothetical protein I6J77_12305 [Rhodanobacter sp. FDAARGOS 1247]|uniref:hypothetical protein n=1 Tax=Rhodanobacter sp. FDAARGOS 1247 TaxID=2778082 RepID=UPI00194DC9E6|nr:hypothetical protein [Rhodanobacter sp. FDAARGOS 1247]QRP62907.1 hypothetical protein I6J77_12305 [Rhodanobacter sp. FDAARGOS 1247]